MKPIRTLILAALACAPISASAEDSANYQGRTLNYSGNDRPFTNRGTLMLAARATCSQIGATLDRDSSGRYLELRWQRRTIRYVKGDRKYTINGTQRGLNSPSVDRNDVFFLPIAVFKDLTSNAVMEGRGDGNGWGGSGGSNDNNWNDNRPEKEAYYRGRKLSFSGDERPYSHRGTTMLPVRSTASQLGASFDRSDDGRRFTMSMGRDRVEVEKGRTEYFFNGSRRSMNPTTQDRREVLFAPISLFQALVGRDLTERSGGWGGSGGSGGNGGWGGSGGSGGGWHGTAVYYRGNRLRFAEKEAPYSEYGTTQVPLRALAGLTGLSIDRSDDGRRLSINGRGDRVEYDKGANFYRINGRRESLGRARSSERDTILFVPIQLFRALLGRDLTGG